MKRDHVCHVWMWCEFVVASVSSVGNGNENFLSELKLWLEFSDQQWSVWKVVARPRLVAPCLLVLSDQSLELFSAGEASVSCKEGIVCWYLVRFSDWHVGRGTWLTDTMSSTWKARTVHCNVLNCWKVCFTIGSGPHTLASIWLVGNAFPDSMTSMLLFGCRNKV